ncbi:hypothetical protein V6N22_003570 [Providencia stuartii]|uniref:hypothetical protein n=1 Tax=Providencia stuartii TaxID=588 RepID=UPI0005389ABD|nr:MULTISPECIES: hypothetical protein [Providencia]HEM8887253.1 hypothetical protein [Proteus mirabilis]AXO20122.1 hypothetical protein MC79_016920 [Providencia stuartii]MBG5904367.1 hypothetical protein [Providencia stuartii]MBG5912359.1 hypothetical protein [Providencia stuartii]MBG5917521.1 hypothetical protein [Providencia stuartii]
MSEFTIKGAPSDYYTEHTGEDGITRYSANRQMIRNYAQGLHEHQVALIQSGGDIYTSSLDESDRFNLFISNEPLDAQMEILNTLTQETEAITNRVNDNTAAIYQEAAINEEKAKYTGEIIGAIVLFVIFMLFIFN